MTTAPEPGGTPPPPSGPPKAARLALWKMILIGLAFALGLVWVQAVLSIQVFDLWYAMMDHRATFGGGEQWVYLGFMLVVEPMNLVVMAYLFGVVIPVTWRNRTVPFRIRVWLAWSVVPIALAFFFLVGGPPELLLPLLAVELLPLAAALFLVLSRLNRRLG